MILSGAQRLGRIQAALTRSGWPFNRTVKAPADVAFDFRSDRTQSALGITFKVTQDTPFKITQRGYLDRFRSLDRAILVLGTRSRRTLRRVHTLVYGSYVRSTCPRTTTEDDRGVDQKRTNAHATWRRGRKRRLLGRHTILVDPILADTTWHRT